VTHDEASPLLVSLVGLHAAPAEEAELRAHVRGCPDCARRLMRLQRLTAALGARSDGLTPSAELVWAIRGIPTRPATRTARWRRRLVPAGVAVAVASSVAAVVLSATRPDPIVRPPALAPERTLALRSESEQISGVVRVGYRADSTRVLQLDVEGLPGGGPSSFDLWLIGPTGAVRAGSFGPGEDGSCRVELPAPASGDWKRVAITPTGAGPAGRVVAASSPTG
jgi:hypothetical protein